MRASRFWLSVVALGAVASVFAQVPIQRMAKTGAAGIAAAVRVADGPLVFTGQVAAPDPKADARTQADRALDALGAILESRGSDLTRVVRLNAYVATAAAVPAVEAAVAARFATAPVAFTLVCTPLGHDVAVRAAEAAVATSFGAEPMALTPLRRPNAGEALVHFDAVAATSRNVDTIQFNTTDAVLPAGGKIFVSGQAEKSTDLGTSSRATMEKLFRSLAHVGLKPTDVVQVKAFIRPFTDHAAATREIAKSFGTIPAPPIVLVEWQSDLFTEIELVASAKSLPPPAGDTISFTFLPGFTRSPRFCHITHIAAGTPLIFIAGVDGGDSAEPRVQMKTIMERLGSVLFEAGSSYRNLAKATYYLVDPKAQALLGDIRGVYYDPNRPPAASAIRVESLGHAGRAAMFDMVAVPVGKL